MDVSQMTLESFVGWGGQTRYRCPACEFDSYDPAIVMGHFIGLHPEEQGGLAFDGEDEPEEEKKVIITDFTPETLEPRKSIPKPKRRRKTVTAPETLS